MALFPTLLLGTLTDALSQGASDRGTDTLWLDRGEAPLSPIDGFFTHYCCLDAEQIAAHHQLIWHWVMDGRVKTAVLPASFLTFYPEAAADARFTFVTDADSCPEVEAIQYAMRLGYQTIGLVGMMPAMQRNSLAGFAALRDEIVQQALDVSIVTCDRPSELHNQGIFPYRSVESLLGQQQLGALVIPTQVHEGDRLLQNLRLWQIPAFTPFLHMQGREKVRLIFTFTGEADASITAAIQTAYGDSPILQRYFHPPEFHFFLLPEGEDVYIKDGNVPLGKKGFASGPNQQFFRSLFAVQDCGPYAFFLETDCLPLRPDWLGALCDAVQTTDEFWVMGSHYRGAMGLFKHFGRHINGSAVYAVGNPNFMAFVEEWQVILNEVVAHQNPIVAYDSVLEYFFYYEFVSDKGTGKKIKPDAKGWQLFQRIAAYFRYSDYILNYSSPADQIAGDKAFQSHLQHFRTKHENAYLIHNKSLCDAAYRQL
ncbi:MAG: hypothetical protein AAFY26_07180 [Cyanobacteria bacterium J06638_22]